MKLKTICLLLWLIMFSGLSINAQNFKFGLLTGLNITNAHRLRSELYESNFYPAFTTNINGYAGFKSSGSWGFSFEPGYIQKAGNSDPTEKLYPDNYATYKANYLQFPFLFDFYISNKLFLSVGPEIAWNIRVIRIKYTEISGLLGVNYNLTENIDIGLRYNHGFTPTYYDGNIKDYNQYLQLIIRFTINTGNKN